MPRRSSGGRPAARAPPRRSPVRNAPQPASHAPPPAPAQGGSGGSMLGGLGSTIAQGMAFGTGSAVAHRAVDAVMGPRTIQHETVSSEGAAAPVPMTNNPGGPDACGSHSKAFQDVCKTFPFYAIGKFYLDLPENLDRFLDVAVVTYFFEDLAMSCFLREWVIYNN
ncbi:uncharacterized protein LOC131164767 isoform X1 [Malania oleifera]|uniref:uncharacterized protein LOC131164767 isoform X1 n=1 Tax=Malania oleifera TaxID=397392 RepID=UPI0025AE9B8A|nr:uncharacterized protein LOC131164767 isoform X1 [Malania oleifera]